MARSPLMTMALGFMPAQAINAAAELGIADLLATGPRSVDGLAAATETHRPSLLRLLRALTALGILTQVGSDRFDLAEAGHQLRSDAPDSVRDFVRVICHPTFWQAWGDLTGSVRSGEPAVERVVGTPIFDHLARHPEMAGVFNAGMSDVTRQAAPGIVAGYDFTPFGTIVDLGGGDGTLLAEVLRAAPRARGVLFDLPAGLEQAPAVLEAAGVADRCRVVAGDFFESVPSGDLYMMKSVIHDWDDERAVAILRNCRAAMADTGRVLVVERAVPEVVTPRYVELLMIDLNMMVSVRGRERTTDEYRQLLAAAGFTLGTVSDHQRPFGDQLIEGLPA